MILFPSSAYLTIAVKATFLSFTMSSPWTAIRNPFVSGSDGTSRVGSTRINGGELVRKFFASFSSPSTTRLVVTPRNV